MSPTESSNETSAIGEGERDGGPVLPSIAERHACESDEERAVDIARLLPVAIASIREEEPDLSIACDEPVPLCLAPVDGSQCVYQLGLYPEVIRVDLWPRAEERGVVRAEAVLFRDLSGSAAPPRVEARRWSVKGAIRCLGESDQRSYGGGAIGSVTASSIRITCENGNNTERPIRILGVKSLAPRRGNAVVRSFEPRVLAPTLRTAVTVHLEPTNLALKAENAFRVTIDVDGHILEPVAQVTTPERMQRR